MLLVKESEEKERKTDRIRERECIKTGQKCNRQKKKINRQTNKGVWGGGGGGGAERDREKETDKGKRKRNRARDLLKVRDRL